jgi:plastocyanin
MTFMKVAMRALGAGTLALTMLSPALAEEIVVEVQGGPPFKFEQPNVTIKPGDTIKWVNKSGALHTVTADEDGALTGTNNLEADGVTSAHAETVKGGARTIHYHCDIHPKMKGTITVAEAKPSPRPEQDVEDSPQPAPKVKKKKPRRSNGGGYGGGGYGGY